ncbi:hypothetical protein KsCSTR_16870 [Candidatus Kuenenia stuttgartiensis]|jgi:hypothetical protein|uniref:Uncharacterized protein n=1 Tax=Kuenenia stuttgartiensis TaxID=174633 RepID=Q1Q1Z4_KUEST|nr:hypothetical protein KsCSTR_16870 [Candidatus Kuenenia stuttgartiensis]CAJ74035.1 unknown protein [Candidatus Kuenenia stuttgartiensis]
MLRHGVNTIKDFSPEVNPMHFRFTWDNISGTLQRASLIGLIANQNVTISSSE